jgi:gamma-glutamyltranspeptidase/glutathione hydrolase
MRLWERHRMAVILVVALAACGTPAPTPEAGHPAQVGMVSSAHPIATAAGLEILEAGGNAFDAAVAVAATLNVVEPMMSGMGGYGTILVYSAEEGRARFLNASDRIPRGVQPDLFRAPTPGHLENRRGAKAVSTPGNVRAWEAMSEEYGRLEWRTLFGPAMRAAAEGFELDERAADMIERAFAEFSDYSRDIYGTDGGPLRAGDVLVQADLARSLRAVAEQGPEAFHGGDIGRAIDEAMRQADGFLRLEDIEASVAEWWEPIGIDYRGYRVLTASPPSTAFPSLVRLGLMSRFDVAAMGHNSADYLHTFAEATKHAFWTRLKYAGDPEIQPPPLGMLLSQDYWQQQAGAIDAESATPFEYPEIEAADPNRHTTHFVVADIDGNVVSATQTLGNAFGSRIMPVGTGIWLNNSLAYCTFEPPGNPMDAHPGRRKLSGDAPTFVMRDGRVWVAIGTPGGHTIGQTVPQMVMNVVDFGMPVQEAIDAPRISFVEPDLIIVEEGIEQAVRAVLEARGHELRTGTLGNAHGLSIEYDASGRPVRFAGGADRRGVGRAQGR